MDYGTGMGFLCLKLMEEKRQILERAYATNKELTDLYKYEPTLLPDTMRNTFYNKESEYKTRLEYYKKEIDKIDTEFNIVITGILYAFSKTNIIDYNPSIKSLCDFLKKT